MTEKNNFYQLRSSYPLSNWGDYGQILVSGMSKNRDGWLQGPSLLSRTGPFIPPITFPFDIVVTDELKIKLEESGLTGFTFREVIKHKIVNLDWTKWDQKAEDPQIYPKSGEPEDYITRRRHSQELADQMPDLWEIRLSEGIGVNRKSNEIFIKPATWNGSDIFYAEGTLRAYVTEQAKKWFEEHVGEWVAFEIESKIE